MRVVVAVCCNEQGQVLLAQRAATAHLGGTWEFPGGKVELGESDEAALCRELYEELGLKLGTTPRLSPLLTRQFTYPDRSLTIQAYVLPLAAAQCESVSGREGQSLRWLKPDAINTLPTPAANAPLIAALCWPAYWHITPDIPATAEQVLLDWLALRTQTEYTAAFTPRHGLVLRLPQWPLASYIALARQFVAKAKAAGLPVLLHGDVSACAEVAAFGFHASSQQAAQWREQGLTKADVLAPDMHLAVASHSADELKVAEAVAADWAWLSPVLPTPSHAGAAALGWPAWASWVQATTLPVYALGGLQPSSLVQARAHGGVGVAGITGF